ncbi:MAG: succinate dehydrogenase cytochrome b subunit [bacterium]|nr:succinate dehydrogenase cytochrome b subunit [bacterium]
MDTIQVSTMSSHRPVTAYKSSIGMKLLMGITGFTFIGFVTGHMIGNLQVFLGPEKLNAYAHTLQSLGALLWIIRLSLFTFFAVHIFFGIKLWLENKASRPIPYVKEVNVESTFSSRIMIWSGLAMFSFVVYHLLHFTLIVTNPEYAVLKENLDVYSMMVVGFSNYWISAVYVVAMIFLSLHVNHAVFSMFQTFGLTNAKWIPLLRRIGNLYAILILVGYVSMPIAVLLNIITLH